MKLYMVRHGQSETNLTQRFTGWAQVNLTEKGRMDAENAGRFLRPLSFDRVYTSDLIRAVQTAQIALPGCQPIQTPLLREINLAALEYKTTEECAAQYGEAFHRHRTQIDFTAYGGESHAMICDRVRRFLDMLVQSPCENAVAFAHAGTLFAAMDVVFETSIGRRHLRCPNGCIAIFVYENDRWALQSWGAGQT